MAPNAVLAPTEALVVHNAPVNHVALSADGSLMATSDTELNVRLWSGGQLVRNFDMRNLSEKVRPTERVRGLGFTRDGKRLFVVSGEQVTGFAIAGSSVEVEWSYVAPRLWGFLIVSPSSLAISGKDTVAAGFDNGSLVCWTPGGAMLSKVRHNAVPRQIAFLPDETIVGSDGFSVSLWRCGQRKPLWHRPSKERIYSSAASHDGSLVALRHLFTTSVVSTADGHEVARYAQGRGLPLIAFASHAPVLAQGTQHGIALHVPGSAEHTSIAIQDAELISLGFSGDGKQMLAGCSDGRIRIWPNPFG